jgi:hypothetical protein
MRHLVQNLHKRRLGLSLLAFLVVWFAFNVPLASTKNNAAEASRRSFGLLYTYYTDNTYEFECGNYNSCSHVAQGCHTPYVTREPIICGEGGR